MLWYGFIAIFLCLVTSIFSHTKIFITLRHQQTQLQDHAQQPNQANQLNIQEGGVQCNMAPTDAGRLLSTLLCSGGFMDSQRTISIIC